MRFVALLGLDRAAAARRNLAGLDGLVTAFEGDNLLVLANRDLPVLDLDGGVLLGDIFARGEEKPAEALGAACRESLRVSQGKTLIDTRWGSYVAIWRDAGTGQAFVLRAPLGRLPAYYCPHDQGCVVASDPRLLTAVTGDRPQIDWCELARRIAQADLWRDRTCLDKIEALRGGDRLLIDKRAARTTTLWTPWAALDWPRLEEKQEASARLRDSVRLSVAASTARHARTLLQLSGGIDSSIVAACLARAGRDFSCVNFRMRGRGGDEADHARVVAEHMGAGLRVVEPDEGAIDLEASAARDMPFPARRGFEQAMDRLSQEQARSEGATAVLDGGGGDNVFFAMLSITPAAEMLKHHFLGKPFREIIDALSDLTGNSKLWLTWKAIGCARRGRARPRPPLMLSFLSPDARTLIRDFSFHPWLNAPVGPFPAKAAMISGLAPAQCLVESRDPLADLPQISVLLTQPLVETCVRVDSRLWFAPGQTRALARHAFAAELPSATMTRRSKGTPDGFVAALYARRRPQLRAMLLDGLLAENGLIDREAVARVLSDQAPIANTDFVRMMELVDAEAWARCWS